MINEQRIQNIEYSQNDLTVSWCYDDAHIVILACGIPYQVENWKQNDCVVVLSSSSKERYSQPDKLNIYNATGLHLCSFPTPDGYDFLYINHHNKLGISVICGVDKIDDERTDLSDWRFQIDLQSERLIRHSRSR